MSARFDIEILNWEKFNPRKDVNNPSWFRFEHSLFFDPEWDSFDAEEISVWLFLLSFCSFKKKSSFPCDMQMFSRKARASLEKVESALEKLEKMRCISITSRARDADVTSTLRARDVCVSYAVPTDGRNETDETRRDDSGPSVDVPPAKVLTIPKEPTLGSRIWDSFSDSYFQRYKVEPIRNKTTNSQCKQLGERLGEDAIEIVKFYVKHNDGFYLKGKHNIGLCLNSAEGLYTQWKQGRATTSNDVRQFEATDHYRAQLARVESGEL